MNRCDFSSVMISLIDYVAVEKAVNQAQLIEYLFRDYLCSDEAADFTLDIVTVSRWINGTRAVNTSIAKYYSDNGHFDSLVRDIETSILPLFYDPDAALQSIYELLIQDRSISDPVKRSMGRGYPFSSSRSSAVFLAKVITFSINRNFAARSGSSGLSSDAQNSPCVQDYILGAKPPKPCSYFCGRDAELCELHDMLQKDHKVFLHGIPGIGKSELAKAYAEKYKDEYTNILYLSYSGDLHKDLTFLEFIGDVSAVSEDVRFHDHLRFLYTLKEDTLLMIDNFNVTEDQDPMLEEIMEFSCRVLFTTRCRYEDYPRLELREIDDPDALTGLFRHFYPDADADLNTVQKIIQTVHRHTLAVELSARLLHLSMISPKELLRKLILESVKMSASDVIHFKKDKKHHRATYRDHIRTLFSLYKLPPSELDLMRYMVLMPPTGVDPKFVATWLFLPDLNDIHSLIEKGFIHPEDDHIIFLHPMIREVADAETLPSVTNCNTLIQNIHLCTYLNAYDIPRFRQVCQTIETIITSIRNDSPAEYLAFLQDTIYPLEKYHCDSTIRLVNKTVAELLQSGRDISPLAKARYLHAKSQEAGMDASKRISLLEEAVLLLYPVTPETAADACMFHQELSGCYCSVQKYDEAMYQINRAVQIYKDFSLNSMPDSISCGMQFAICLAHKKDFDAAWKTLNMLNVDIQLHYGPKSCVYAQLKQAMANVSVSQNNMKKAKQYYQEAFQLYREIYADDPVNLAFYTEKEREIMSYFP